jgi:peptidoglycan/LPS O-acetylase OafA/YrhL
LAVGDIQLQHTVASRLEQTKSRSSGFDYLRISLSVSVILWHTIVVCYGSDAEVRFWGSPLRPLLYFILPSFFALSGFLVAGSLFRNSISAFLTLRAIRIFPALFCEVMISALILGPTLTVFSLQQYFSDLKFYTYFLNLIGWMHYYLPGLFLDNPFPQNVNNQLWTIPFELECYIAITVLAIVGVAKRFKWLAAVFVATTIAACAVELINGSGGLGNGGPSGRLCVMSFLAGVTIYVGRDRIRYSASYVAIAIALYLTILTFRGFDYLVTLPIAYVTVWLGLQDPKKLFIVAGADYSYGMYLYGFPMQQATAYLLPQHRLWYVNFVLSVAAAGITAFLSWHFVESRIMKRKSSIVDSIERRIQRLQGAAQSTTLHP